MFHFRRFGKKHVQRLEGPIKVVLFNFYLPYGKDDLPVGKPVFAMVILLGSKRYLFPPPGDKRIVNDQNSAVSVRFFERFLYVPFKRRTFVGLMA